MKFGFRKLSIKNSISSRTTGAGMRKLKSAVIPGYGKKGAGWIKNPKKALYNKAYHKTTVGMRDALTEEKSSSVNSSSGLQYPQINTHGIIRRDCQIMTDCVNFVNTSNNLSTVLSRFNLLLTVLERLMLYSQEELDSEGVSFPVPLSVKYQEILDHKDAIINQAIDRAFEKVKDDALKLKTRNGQSRKMVQFVEESMDLEGISFGNRIHLEEIKSSVCKTYGLEQENESDPSTQDVFSYPDAENDIGHSKSYYRDRHLKKHETTKEKQEKAKNDILHQFYSLSQIIERSSDINEQLRACEESYKILWRVVFELTKNQTPLPPVIMCRDKGPELYMRLGDWEKAEHAIDACISAKAYFPNNKSEGRKRRKYLGEYKIVADTAMEFIRNHPGTLQRNLYKNLPDLDRDLLKHFLRCSLQLKKEKSGNTNKLYPAETSLQS